MTREEAVKAMMEGKKVTHSDFDPDDYCYYDPTNIFPFRFVSQDAEHTIQDDRMHEAWNGLDNNWKIYEKVKVNEFHRHEVIDRLHMVNVMIEEFLLNHPAVSGPLRTSIEIGANSLAKAYQLAGGKTDE